MTLTCLTVTIKPIYSVSSPSGGSPRGPSSSKVEDTWRYIFYHCYDVRIVVKGPNFIWSMNKVWRCVYLVKLHIGAPVVKKQFFTTCTKWRYQSQLYDLQLIDKVQYHILANFGHQVALSNYFWHQLLIKPNLMDKVGSILIAQVQIWLLYIFDHHEALFRWENLYSHTFINHIPL